MAAKKDLPRSPLAPKRFPALPALAGVTLASAKAKIRYDRTDVMLAAFDPGTTVAGVFTTSKTASPAVEWCRARAKKGVARALIVNSGNANAFTGQEGARAVAATTAAVALTAGCRADEVFVSSTGVIGEKLPVERLIGTLPTLRKALKAKNWDDAANAIRTTDTYPKGATKTFRLDAKTYRINGIAKGSGMIAPDMATMLAYVFTDAKLPAAVLRETLRDSVATTFNAITVDSDTSTSDTLLLFATGAGPKHKPVGSVFDKRLDGFKAALHVVLLDLAQQVVRDGEGAAKFITVNVTGATSDKAAKRIAMSIANSPLIKTAIAGGDPNWGRVVMAVGKSGEKADRDRLRIQFGDTLVAEKGQVAAGYKEAFGAKYMKQAGIEISVDIGLGKGRFTAWTCDFTHGYIAINADYRS